MGCMEDGLSVWVGCERWEMMTLFARFERHCIHEGKEGKEAVALGDLERKLKRKKRGGGKGDGSDTSVSLVGGQSDLEEQSEKALWGRRAGW